MTTLPKPALPRTMLERLLAVVSPVVDACGVELFDADYRGGSFVLLVDESAGINADRLAEVTRAVSRALDEADPIPGHYTLEVSSPGVERPLRTPAHFAGAVGETVSIKAKVDVQGQRRFVGLLLEAGDDGVVLVDGNLGNVAISYDVLDKARTVFQWGPGPKPGKAPKAAKPVKDSRETSAMRHDDRESPNTPESPGDPDDRVAAGQAGSVKMRQAR